MYLTLLPAYGRDYKSKKAFIEDIKSNKDFIVAESRQYINKQQFKELNINEFNIRYKNLTQVKKINVSKDL
tara:strand:+ start:27 stop:239 length:213 start_codon:yes stop_codon:yes gene_type:complete